MVCNVFIRTLTTHVEQFFPIPAKTHHEFNASARRLIGVQGILGDQHLYFMDYLHGMPTPLVEMEWRRHTARGRVAIACRDTLETQTRQMEEEEWPENRQRKKLLVISGGSKSIAPTILLLLFSAFLPARSAAAIPFRADGRLPYRGIVERAD